MQTASMILAGAVLVFAIVAAAGYTRIGFVGAGSIKIGFRDTVLFLFLSVTALYAGIVAAKFFVSKFGEGMPEAVFPATILFQTILIVFSALFAKFADAKFDFLKVPSIKTFSVSFAFFLFSIILVSLSGFEIASAYKIITGEYPEKQSIVEMFGDIKNGYILAMGIFSVVVLAPVSEELFFRCFLYRMLKGWFSDLGISGFGIAAISAIISASLFAFAHANFFAFIPLIIMGCILAAVYEKTGNLFAPIITHALFNASNAALILLFA